MTSPREIWFAPSTTGRRVVPVTPQGRMAVAGFVAGMILSPALGVTVALKTGNMVWFPVIFAVGALVSAATFITLALRHADRRPATAAGQQDVTHGHS